jgi:hypothetical protein
LSQLIAFKTGTAMKKLLYFQLLLLVCTASIYSMEDDSEEWNSEISDGEDDFPSESQDGSSSEFEDNGSEEWIDEKSSEGKETSQDENFKKMRKNLGSFDKDTFNSESEDDSPSESQDESRASKRSRTNDRGRITVRNIKMRASLNSTEAQENLSSLQKIAESLVSKMGVENQESARNFLRTFSSYVAEKFMLSGQENLHNTDATSNLQNRSSIDFLLNPGSSREDVDSEPFKTYTFSDKTASRDISKKMLEGLAKANDKDNINIKNSLACPFCDLLVSDAKENNLASRFIAHMSSKHQAKNFSFEKYKQGNLTSPPYRIHYKMSCKKCATELNIKSQAFNSSSMQAHIIDTCPSKTLNKEQRKKEWRNAQKDITEYFQITGTIVRNSDNDR